MIHYNQTKETELIIVTKKEMKIKAQDIIMHQISACGYALEGTDLEHNEEFKDILKQQMDRIGKLFGFDGAWFS